MEMILRYSQIIPDRDRVLGVSVPVNQMAYKCPECASVVRFNVTDEKVYLEKILERRGGRLLYLPPKEEWSKESEEIARQLEALGYFGGMDIKKKKPAEKKSEE